MKKLVLILVLVSSMSAFAWKKTFGVVVGDFSIDLRDGVRLHLVTQSDLSPTSAFFLKSRSWLKGGGQVEGDQYYGGCFKSVEIKDGNLEGFQYVAPISDDVAKTLLDEDEYAHHSRIEVGLYEDTKKQGYFRTIIVVYDSRNAPAKIFNDEVGQTPFNLSLGTTYSQESRRCVEAK